MPTIQKVLGQSAPFATTLTDAYTVPALTSAVVSSIMVSNSSATPSSFKISIAVAGAADTAKQYIYSGIVCPGNDTFAATLGLTLGAGDVVRVYATNATLAFGIFGCETS